MAGNAVMQTAVQAIQKNYLDGFFDDPLNLAKMAAHKVQQEKLQGPDWLLGFAAAITFTSAFSLVLGSQVARVAMPN